MSMRFCSRCSFELMDGDLFCQKCGKPVKNDALSSPATRPASNQVNIDSLDIPEMTLEESIILCEKAQREFNSLEKKNREVSEITRKLDNGLQYSNAQYSTFHFFWPTLIFAFISIYVGVIFMVLIGRLYLTNSVYYFSYTLPFLFPIAVLIIGWILAARKRDRENAWLADINREKGDQRKKLREDKESLLHEISTLKAKLNYDYQWIPEKFRKSSSIRTMIRYLKSGQAQDIKSALKMLR